MTRGRKKDLTIPPTRVLSQQRAYRDRRAKYVGELEERCRKAEEENSRLRTELEAARAGVSPNAMNNLPAMTQASSELLQQLLGVSVSIARYQQLVFGQIGQGQGPPHPSHIIPTDSTLANLLSPSQVPLSAPLHFPPGASLSREPDFSAQRPPPSSATMDNSTAAPQNEQARAWISEDRRDYESDSDECCGGIINCEGLVDEEPGSSHAAAPTSHLRSQNQTDLSWSGP